MAFPFYFSRVQYRRLQERSGVSARGIRTNFELFNPQDYQTFESEIQRQAHSTYRLVL